MEISVQKMDDTDLESDDQLDCWDPDKIVQHASNMSKVKEAHKSEAKHRCSSKEGQRILRQET